MPVDVERLLAPKQSSLRASPAFAPVPSPTTLEEKPWRMTARKNPGSQPNIGNIIHLQLILMPVSFRRLVRFKSNFKLVWRIRRDHESPRLNRQQIDLRVLVLPHVVINNPAVLHFEVSPTSLTS